MSEIEDYERAATRVLYYMNIEVTDWSHGVALEAITHAFECEEMNEDCVFDIADSSVPVYTHDLWEQFAKVKAWSVTEMWQDLYEMQGASDIDQIARTAMYGIGSEIAGQVRQLIEDEELGSL